MILDRSGLPVPPSGVVERLQQVNPNLGVAWVGDVGSGWWAITQSWSLTDPRRAMIQRGEVPEDGAFDVIVYLPPDCDVHQAFGYFQQAVQTSNRESVRSMLDRLDEYNRQQVQQNWNLAADPALERASHKLVGTPFSAGGIETPATPKRRGRPPKPKAE